MLSLGAIVACVSLVMVQLQPGAGQSLTGVVRDASGPVAGARVVVWSAGPREGPAYLCPGCYADCGKAVETDATGVFAIKDLDPSLVFRLLVVREGYQPQFVKADPRELARVGKGAAVTLVARPMGQVPAEQVVRGVVKDASGKVVAGAVVTPGMVWWGGWTEGAGGAVAGLDPIAVTNAKGEWELVYGKACDGMDITVEARGFSLACWDRLASSGKVHEVVVKEGGKVTGTVMWAGKPAAGVEVGIVTTAANASMCHDRRSLATDEHGRFEFTNVVPIGEQTVFVQETPEAMKTQGGFGSLAVKIKVNEDGKAYDTGPIMVLRGHKIRGRVVTSDGAPLPPETVLTFVTDRQWKSAMARIGPDGSFEVAGVMPGIVEVWLNGGGKALKHEFAQANESSVDWIADRLEGVVNKDIEEMVIRLDPVGTFVKPSALVQVWEKPLKGLAGFDGSATLSSDAAWEGGRTMEGVVKGAKGPVGGAVVLVRSAMSRNDWQYQTWAEGVGTRVVTDAQGRYRIDGLDPAYQYSLIAVTQDGAGSTQQGYKTLPEGDQPFVVPDISIEARESDEEARVIRGKVVDASGKGVKDAAVIVTSINMGVVPRQAQRTKMPTWDRAAMTDETGTFELRGGSAESLSVIVQAEGMATLFVEKLGAKEGEASLVVDGGAKLFGRVTLNGKSVKGVLVRVTAKKAQPDVGPAAWTVGARTNDAGDFTLEGVPKGVDVEVTMGHQVGNDAWYARAMINVDRERTEFPLGEFMLTPGVRLAGRLEVPEAVKANARVVMLMMMETGEQRCVRVDDKGRFAFGGVRPGAPVAVMGVGLSRYELAAEVPSPGWPMFPGVMGAARDVNDLALKFVPNDPKKDPYAKKTPGPLRGIAIPGR